MHALKARCTIKIDRVMKKIRFLKKLPKIDQIFKSGPQTPRKNIFVKNFVFSSQVKYQSIQKCQKNLKNRKLFFLNFFFTTPKYLTIWGAPGTPKNQKNQKSNSAMLFLMGLALICHITLVCSISGS